MVPEGMPEDKELTAFLAPKLSSSEKPLGFSCLTASDWGLGLAPFFINLVLPPVTNRGVINTNIIRNRFYKWLYIKD